MKHLPPTSGSGSLFRTWFSFQPMMGAGLFYRAAVIAAVAFSIALPARGQQEEQGAFRFIDEAILKVDWQGEPLIVADRLEAVTSGELDGEEGQNRIEKEGVTVSNRWKVSDPHGQVTWRRETALRDEGRELELTMVYRVPSYYYEDKSPKLDSFYRVLMDLKRFEGGSFQAKVKKGSSYDTVTGKILDGELVPEVKECVTWITLRPASGGKPVSIDLGPHGVTSFNSWVGPNSLPESWWASSGKGVLRFAIGRYKKSMHPHNGIYFGKMVIREAPFEDYTRYHAYERYLYFMEMPAYRQYHFGARPPEGARYEPIAETAWTQLKNRVWQALGDASYEERLGAGWVKRDGLELTGKPERGLLRSGLRGRGEAELRVDLPDPGIYIFTLRAAAERNGVGLFDLEAGGELAVKGGKIGNDEVKTYTFARNVKEGHLTLKFSGQWTLNTLAVQKLIHSPEDFAFDRGLWLAEELPAPTNLYRFERRPIPALAAEQAYPISSGSGDRKGIVGVHPKITFPQDDPASYWRWESDINALGPGRGSLHEFETDAQITRRLDELLAGGYKVLLINPQLIRHAIPEEHPRMRATMKRIAEHAHRRGMKVIDHFDVTIIPNMGAAYQEMVENPDWLQRSVRTGEITRGYCINNPGFQKHFIGMMVEYVKEAKIDGVMLDEVCWHAESFCGCEYCRKKFSAETRLELPTDGEHPDLLNRDSRLWKSWLQWRMRAQGDFCVDLLKAIREVHPEFIWMKYGAPTVYVSDYSSVRSGISLGDAQRYANYIGIEILSGNLHASYRSNLAVGSIFNGLTQGEDVAAFGLVYHQHNPSIAYAGWAQNNMNRQRTWFSRGSEGVEADGKRYTSWADNMPLRTVSQKAEIGVWFSEITRDFSKQKKLAMEDLVGTCEQLDDLHFPYEVIQDQRMTAERLNAYRLVILPNVAALADEHLALLEDYLKKGGRVLATGYTARQDDLGFERKEWPFAQWFGAIGGVESISEAQLDLPGENGGEGVTASFAVEPLKIALEAERSKAEVLYGIQYSGETAPGVVRVSVGRGELIWSAMHLGAENFEHDARNNTRPVFARVNPAGRQLLGRLVGRALGGQMLFQPVAIPREVSIRVYETPGSESGPVRSFVHLYNGSGSLFRPNQPNPLIVPSVPFPRIESEIVFDLTLPFDGDAEAIYVTPDTPRSTPVALERLDGKRWRAKLPGGTLEAYGMVRLQPKTPTEVAQD